MKKKKFKFSHLYLGLVMAITYLPLIMVVIFSFNDSKLTVSWKGFIPPQARPGRRRSF